MYICVCEEMRNVNFNCAARPNVPPANVTESFTFIEIKWRISCLKLIASIW